MCRSLEEVKSKKSFAEGDEREIVQSGFVLSGEAMTIPESALDAQEPAEPILHKRSLRAIGLSVAMKESTERFRSSASRCLTLLGSGNAKTACKARVPKMRREGKACMIG